MQGTIGKKRNPVGVWLLSLVTLGIYYLVWWYKVNRETRDMDGNIKVTPGLSVLALFGFYIGAFITVFRTGKRIGQAQAAAGLAPSSNGWLGIVLMIVFSTHVIYYQSELNKIWASYPEANTGDVVPHRTAAAGSPAYAG